MTNPNETPIITPERQAQLEALMVRVIELVSIRAGWARSCLNCSHFAEGSGELCTLAGARPPARVIVHGCPSHEARPF